MMCMEGKTRIPFFRFKTTKKMAKKKKKNLPCKLDDLQEISSIHKPHFYFILQVSFEIYCNRLSDTLALTRCFKLTSINNSFDTVAFVSIGVKIACPLVILP